ncbi:spore germination protein KA [Lentibacillus persicus]|uniref:Spore germination protein KA n=1 Tax=Lentibacillus persicus TaxID=640948 RepID=A0A1I1S0T7_9BACI|nr:spore germination protein [Lentibacillus persicus]SFD39957.1 spore germination protein KA [Lentibacillus persicus]
MKNGQKGRLPLKRRRLKQQKAKQADKTAKLEPSVDSKAPLSDSLRANENTFRSIYDNSSDVIFRPFYIGEQVKALLIYIEGLSNIEEIDDSVLSPLIKSKADGDTTVDTLINKKVAVSDVKKVTTFSDSVKEIASGSPVIIVDQQTSGFALGLSKWENRSVEEPQAEMVVRGPREGFVETIGVNTSLIRRRIRSPKLKMKAMEAGEYTKTAIKIAYIDGVADQSVIKEAASRINRIDVDGILDSGVLEEYIEDHPQSPFPQVLSTERPDIVSANLLEGRVAILVDGSPFVLIVPATFYSLLQSSEDYYGRFLIGTSIRWLRYFFLLISLFLPSLYVALLTYHQEMVPTTLLFSIAASRAQVPFPALIEALMMEITFEALREAGLRLPKQVGSAVSIVGALVIGEAAVSAGIVSAPMVIVVALTGVASFTIPRYSASAAVRMLRFPMIFLAGTLGLLGIMLGIIGIIVHMATIRSFGEPYLSPMAPMKWRGMKDVLIRAPWWKLNTRPRFTGETNDYRQADNQKPSPIRGKD